MELRTLLYGYNKHQFRFLINETESAVVRGIFDEYISGGTLQKIAARAVPAVVQPVLNLQKA